jgi:hypothetical protein
MIRAFQWDLARQAERLDWLLLQLPRYADWGYTELYVHLEDALEFPSLPGVARRDAYSRSAFGRLVSAAGRSGIGVVPIVNLLGHTQYLIKVPELRDLNELRAPDGSPLPKGQVCPVHPRMLEVAEKLVSDVAPFCTAGRLHVGLDESFSLGRHPLSRAEIGDIGLDAHFGRYVQRLHSVVSGRGLRLGIWADMLALLPGAVAHLPRGISAYDWYYYPFERLPRMEPRNFAAYDLAPALGARGIEYWGCPMNGSFRHEPMPVFGERLANIRDWWRRCQETTAAGMLVTSWESNRLAADLTAVVDAAAACLWLEPGTEGDHAMLAKGFGRVFGGRGDLAARTALASDSRAFAGYARWEVNDHWDACALRGGTAQVASELSFYAGACRRPGLPPPLGESLGFRRYLAERDLFVRSAAARILGLRRRMGRKGTADPSVARGLVELARSAEEFGEAIGRGRRAAGKMWGFSRDRRERGPNGRMAAQDKARLLSLQRWVRAARADPRRLGTPSPVCGAWQLRFDVIVERPALQRVALEREAPGGAWETLRQRTTIEFRARAARPRAKIRREFSVPVDGPALRYRVAARGLGTVTIANVELTDGLRSLRPLGWNAARRAKLGVPAPARGFPEIDWERNTGAVVLGFAKAKRRPR